LPTHSISPPLGQARFFLDFPSIGVPSEPVFEGLTLELAARDLSDIRVKTANDPPSGTGPDTSSPVISRAAQPPAGIIV
jgi:hypothetical protein